MATISSMHFKVLGLEIGPPFIDSRNITMDYYWKDIISPSKLDCARPNHDNVQQWLTPITSCVSDVQ